MWVSHGGRYYELKGMIAKGIKFLRGETYYVIAIKNEDQCFCFSSEEEMNIAFEKLLKLMNVVNIENVSETLI